MHSDVFWWISLSVSIACLTFLLARSRLLQRENENLKNIHRLLQEDHAKECERRAIAEERASRIFELEQMIQIKTENIENLLKDQSELKRELAEKNIRLIQQVQYDEEKNHFLQQAQERLNESFKVISTEAFNHNVQSFLELATARFEKLQDFAKQELVVRQQAIDHLVQPIQSCLQTVEQKMAELEKSRLMAYSSLTEQVSSLARTQTKLQAETANLVKALRMPHVRGRWGRFNYNVS